MRVLVLSRKSELPWYGWAYGPALERLGASISFVAEDAPCHADLNTLLTLCPTRPSLIVRPEFPRFPLPWGLTEVDIPTVLFHQDTYAYTEPRIRWSMLFDYALLFHPGYEERFRRAGHPNLLTLPFGVVRALFDRPEQPRVFEVGWVGRSDWSIYATRQRMLPELARHFRMNDWNRHYTPEEMAEVYRRSKVAVNIARDDYLQDANMRAFEAMAGGALLIARVPSELTALGFEEGVHFVGYRQPDEIVPLVERYLRDAAARQRIAQAARQKVLQEHTYDHRAAALLERIQRDAGRLSAPARLWPEAAVRLSYLGFYAHHSRPDLAWRQLRKLSRQSVPKTLAAAWLLGRAWVRRLRARLARPEPVRAWETGPWPPASAEDMEATQAEEHSISPEAR